MLFGVGAVPASRICPAPSTALYPERLLHLEVDADEKQNRNNNNNNTLGLHLCCHALG